MGNEPEIKWEIMVPYNTEDFFPTRNSALDFLWQI